MLTETEGKSMALFGKNKKEHIAAIAIFASAVIAAAVGAVLLPEKIFVQLFSESSRPETSKALFLIVSSAIVCVSGAMCLFTENAKKWLATEAVLAAAELICIVYNLIVL